MLRDDLLAYGLVPSEVAALRTLIPERLFPLQALAVSNGLLDDEGDMLIAGPAGSGKAALVELLTLHAAHSGRRTLLLRLSEVLETDALPATDLVIVLGLEALRDDDHQAASVFSRLRHLKEAGNVSRPRIIVFSAIVEGAAQLAAELGAKFVASPTPAKRLQVGVLCDGAMVYGPRGEPGARVREELVDSPRQLGPGLLLPTMLAKLARGNRPVLLLLPDEASCERMARRLVEVFGREGENAELLTELEGTAPGRLRSLLGETLRAGVAVYGPGLSPRQRKLVEGAIERGACRIVCASEVPQKGAAFRHVVVGARWRWQRSSVTGRFRQVELDSVDMATLASLCQDGAALFYARSPREAEVIFSQQLEAAPRPLPATFDGNFNLADALFGADFVWRRWADANQKKTPSGEEAPSPLEVLCLVALGPLALPLPLLLSEQPRADYATELLKRAEDRGIAERPLFRWLAQPENQWSHEALRAMKRALLLGDWIEGKESRKIEDAYSISVGAVGRLAADCAQRIDALCRVCSLSGWSESKLQPLRELTARLRSRPVDDVAERAFFNPIGRIIGALAAKAPAANSTVSRMSAKSGPA